MTERVEKRRIVVIERDGTEREQIGFTGLKIGQLFRVVDGVSFFADMPDLEVDSDQLFVVNTPPVPGSDDELPGTLGMIVTTVYPTKQ